LLHHDEEGIMAPDERSRMEVSEALADALGPAATAALMECIPPFGWHEIATKRDLAELEGRIATRFDVMSELFTAKLDGRLHQETTRMIKWMVGSITGLIGAICMAVGVVSAAIS
jgi:hypothetical protein